MNIYVEAAISTVAALTCLSVNLEMYIKYWVANYLIIHYLLAVAGLQPKYMT